MLCCILLSLLSLRAEELHAPDARNHWAFHSPQPPPLPVVTNRLWAKNPVDLFLIAKLEAAGISPSPAASKRLLIRRLSFAIRGLPPTPAEIEVFKSDTAPEAWERLVDRFLASPEFGIRAAQPWLDAVGYADSNGYFNADSDRPHAFRYRDYVIRAFNSDKRFDRFIQEQIAGDELARFTRDGNLPPEAVESLVATHFLRNAPDGTGESDGNPLEMKVDRYTVLEGGVQIIGSSLLGLTLQCARCHSHKFEPVTQDEYYGLQAMLRPAFDPEKWLKPSERLIEMGSPEERQQRRLARARWDQDIKSLNESIEGLMTPYRKRVLETQLSALPEADRSLLKKALDTVDKDRSEPMKKILTQHESVWKLSDPDVAKRFPEVASAYESLRRHLERRLAEKPAPPQPIAHVSEPSSPPPTHHLLIRGNHASEGKAIEPHVPASLTPTGFRANARGATDRVTSGNRVALAEWLTHPSHPLVARVVVNRVWKHYFGVGIVKTLDNLGVSGARPSHPELLDFLATELIRSDWDFKHLTRLILSSAAYRQESTPDRSPPAQDEDNVLLWKMRTLRLDAEQLRDAMLQVSGELDREIGGPYIPMRKDRDGQVVVDETIAGATKRSIFLQRKRTEPLNLMEVFDAPQLNPACAQRTDSTVSLQALTLLNSEFSQARARSLAKQILKTANTSEDQRLDHLFQLSLSRSPSPRERDTLRGFLERQRSEYSSHTPQVAEERAWTDCCQMVLASNEFLYVD